MRNSRRAFFSVVAGLAVASCQPKGSTKPDEYVYKFVEDGEATISDKTSYESLGKRSLSKVQRYKIVAQTDAARKFHILVVRMIQRIGKKKTSDSPATFLPITDGSYTLECSHYYYDVAIATPDDDVPDPVCTIQPLGVINPSAPARLAVE